MGYGQRAMVAVYQTQGGLGDLFPGVDLSTTQAEQAVIAGMVAGGVLAEADARFRWSAFWWGWLAGGLATWAGALIGEGVRRGR